ncbi:MAG: hypothetical protein RL259_1154 [Bacteroidota bacterium]|jgi:hypothetical protein
MKNSIIKVKLTLLFVVISNLLTAQNDSNSIARNLIQNADISMVSRDWTTVATIASGTGETVSFFPIEITDLKTGQKIKALQVDMTTKCGGSVFYRSSWIDVNEIAEFITFIESYVIPKLSSRTTDNRSNTYIFNSKEIVLKFLVHDKNNYNRLSVYLKNEGAIDDNCYFWTETQIGKTRDLLTVLKTINQ